MSLISDVKEILVNKGFNEVTFLSFLPDEPNNIVSLFQSGGFNKPGDTIEEPTFQVKIRNEDYESGYKIATNIKDILCTVTDTVAGDSRYLSFHQLGDILELGRDTKNRITFSLNFRTFVERKTTYNGETGDCSYYQNIINQLNIEITELNAEIEELQELLNNSGGDCSELVTQIEQLELEIANKEANIIHLNEDISQKNSEITELILQNDTKAIRIVELEEDNSVKATQIVELGETISQLNLTISNKNEEINNLTLIISNKDSEIEQLNIDISSKNIQIIELQNVIDTQALAITNYEIEIANKTAIITQLEADIIEKDNTITQLQTTIADLEEQLDGGGGTCVRNRILIDVGTEQYKTTEGNWNNLTDPIAGIIENLINESGKETGIGINVHSKFGLADARGMDIETEHYYNNVIKDAFINNNTRGQLRIFGLNVNKFYRITIFASSSPTTYGNQYIINPTDGLLANQTMHYNFSNNIGDTIAKTLKPNKDGEIYVTAYSASAYINALEIEEL